MPGAGKTQVALVILRKLGEEAFRADLDSFAPENEETAFNALIEDALKWKYVVGELYSGKRHSSEPASWVDKFRETYRIHSFVLKVSEFKGYANCSDARHTSWNPATYEEYHQAYEKFWGRQMQDLFASRAAVPERVIDAEDGNYERVATEVMRIGFDVK